MSNTFDIKRFWNYFKWDLRNARNNYLLSLVICCATPLIMFLLYELFNLIFGNTFDGFKVGHVMAFVLAIFIVELTFPAKAYGRVTEKRYGSEWTLIPASTLEKTLSIILISCVVLPVCFFSMLALWDILLGSLFTGSYGEPIVTRIGSLWSEFTSVLTNDLEGLQSIFGAPIICGWFSGILTFTLGAMIFKKGKVGKTILASMLVGLIFSTILTLINFSDFGGIFGYLSTADDPEKAIRGLKIYIYTSNGITLAALIAGIYLRIRTIKH